MRKGSSSRTCVQAKGAQLKFFYKITSPNGQNNLVTVILISGRIIQERKWFAHYFIKATAIYPVPPPISILKYHVHRDNTLDHTFIGMQKPVYFLTAGNVSSYRLISGHGILASSLDSSLGNLAFLGRLVNGLDNTDSDGLSHITDSETTKRRVYDQSVWSADRSQR